MLKIQKNSSRKKIWIQDESGKRLTKKYKFNELIYEEIGPFISFRNIDTKSTIIFNRLSNDIVTTIKGRPYILDLDNGIYYINSICALFDVEGHIVAKGIKIPYDYHRFLNGLLIAQDISQDHGNDEEKLFGYLDEYLNWVIKPIYPEVKPFYYYKYAIAESIYNYAVVVDRDGNEFFSDKKYTCLNFLSDELLSFSRSRTYDYSSSINKGVVNIHGNEIISGFYDKIWVENGYIFLKKNDKYGLADLNGKMLLECIYPEIIELEDKFVVEDFAKKEVKKTEIIK